MFSHSQAHARAGIGAFPPILFPPYFLVMNLDNTNGKEGTVNQEALVVQTSDPEIHTTQTCVQLRKIMFFKNTTFGKCLLHHYLIQFLGTAIYFCVFVELKTASG